MRACVRARGQLNTLAQNVRGNYTRPFGGIQLVITGDFFQLPPVKARLMAFEAECWGACV